MGLRPSPKRQRLGQPFLRGSRQPHLTYARVLSCLDANQTLALEQLDVAFKGCSVHNSLLGEVGDADWPLGPNKHQERELGRSEPRGAQELVIHLGNGTSRLAEVEASTSQHGALDVFGSGSVRWIHERSIYTYCGLVKMGRSGRGVWSSHRSNRLNSSNLLPFTHELVSPDARVCWVSCSTLPYFTHSNVGVCRPRGMLVGSLVKLLVDQRVSSRAGDVDFRYPRTTHE